MHLDARWSQIMLGHGCLGAAQGCVGLHGHMHGCKMVISTPDHLLQTLTMQALRVPHARASRMLASAGVQPRGLTNSMAHCRASAWSLK